MSTATLVPETIGLDGERAIATIRAARMRLLVKDSFSRLRWADGFSHARAVAFQVVLTIIPGAIVLIAIAAELHWDTLSKPIVQLARSLAPGPTGAVFNDAFDQGAKAGTSVSGWQAIGVGGAAFLISGTTAFGQIERAANRIYGVEADRPALRKYGLATAMMLSSGILAILGFATLGLGQEWAENAQYSLDDAWEVGRWPLSVVLLTLAFALIFKISPRRRQPELSWLAVGGLLGVAGVLIVSLLFHFYLRVSSGFGDTYGPLAGILGVMMWAYLSCIVIFFGVAFAAQLEAIRAGHGEPRDPDKVHHSDPASAPTDVRR
ncbi:MAG: YihY/virulence factor BrkB family protein, partial [Ilumatobacteraceae bacterium]